MYAYPYPRPALAADVVALRGADRREVLLIRRRSEPFAGQWALPGGFVDEWELPVDAARRELSEETGIVWDGPLTLLGVYGKKGRDPRGWTVACAYVVLLGEEAPAPIAADDAVDAAWHPVTGLPAMAFDHLEIVQHALSVG